MRCTEEHNRGRDLPCLSPISSPTWEAPPPVVYAGNKDAAPLVRDTLSEGFDLKVVENLRPTLEREVLEPARTAIHELFMSHVMAHAPGYEKLRSWVDADIVPTPAAAGRMIEVLAYRHRANLFGVDIGGATTDVFSVIDGSFHRSVSANLGMSYSAGNVLIEAGVENVLRWLPFKVPWHQVADRVFTKLINPTTVPRTFMDLQIEQALATELMRERKPLVADGMPPVDKHECVGVASYVDR